MSGWFRISTHARYHHFRPWPSNELFLAATCHRPILLKRSDARVLRKIEDVPASAPICRGCSGSPELRFGAAA